MLSQARSMKTRYGTMTTTMPGAETESHRYRSHHLSNKVNGSSRPQSAVTTESAPLERIRRTSTQHKQQQRRARTRPHSACTAVEPTEGRKPINANEYFGYGGCPTVFDEKNGFRKYCQESLLKRRLQNARKELVKSPAAKKLLKTYGYDKSSDNHLPRKSTNRGDHRQPTSYESTVYSVSVREINDANHLDDVQEGDLFHNESVDEFKSETDIEDEEKGEQLKNHDTGKRCDATAEVARALLDRYHRWKTATRKSSLGELSPEFTESQPIFDSDSFGFTELCKTVERKHTKEQHLGTMLHRTDEMLQRSGKSFLSKPTHGHRTSTHEKGKGLPLQVGTTRTLAAEMFASEESNDSQVEWDVVPEESKRVEQHSGDKYTRKIAKQMSRTPTKDWRYFRTYGGVEWKDMNHLPDHKVGLVIPSMIVEGDLRAVDQIRTMMTEREKKEQEAGRKIHQRHESQRQTLLKRIQSNREWDAEILAKGNDDSEDWKDSQEREPDDWWGRVHNKYQQEKSPQARKDYRMLELPSPQMVPISLKKYVKETGKPARPSSAFTFSKKDKKTPATKQRPVSAQNKLKGSYDKTHEEEIPPYSPYVLDREKAFNFYEKSQRKPRFMQPLSKQVRQRTLVRGRSGIIPENFAWATSVPEGFGLLMSDDVAFPKLMERTKEVLQKKKSEKQHAPKIKQKK